MSRDGLVMLVAIVALCVVIAAFVASAIPMGAP